MSALSALFSALFSCCHCFKLKDSLLHQQQPKYPHHHSLPCPHEALKLLENLYWFIRGVWRGDSKSASCQRLRQRLSVSSALLLQPIVELTIACCTCSNPPHLSLSCPREALKLLEDKSWVLEVFGSFIVSQRSVSVISASDGSAFPKLIRQHVF